MSERMLAYIYNFNLNDLAQLRRSDSSDIVNMSQMRIEIL